MIPPPTGRLRMRLAAATRAVAAGGLVALALVALLVRWASAPAALPPVPSVLRGQEAGSERRKPLFALFPPHPNPFGRRLRIPFALGDSAGPAAARGERVEVPPGGVSPAGEGTSAREARWAYVTVRIYDLLHRRVAHARAAGGRPAGSDGEAVRGRPYPVPGRYEAVWDGRNERGRFVPVGPYFVELVVDGRAQVRKVLFLR